MSYYKAKANVAFMSYYKANGEFDNKVLLSKYSVMQQGEN